MKLSLGRIRILETVHWRSKFAWFRKLPVSKTSNIQAKYAIGKSHTLIIYKR